MENKTLIRYFSVWMAAFGFSGNFSCISDSQTIASLINTLYFPFLNLIYYQKTFSGYWNFLKQWEIICSVTSLQSHLHINKLLLLSLSIVFILQTFAYLNKSYRPHIKFKNKKNWQYDILGNGDAMLLLIYLVPMNFWSQIFPVKNLAKSLGRWAKVWKILLHAWWSV